MLVNLRHSTNVPRACRLFILALWYLSATTVAAAEQPTEQAKPGGWTGVSAWPVCDEIAQEAGLRRPQGAFVAGIYPKSAAERAGLQPGDILLKWNDQWILGLATWMRLQGNANEGDVITVAFVRKQETFQTELTLTAAPDHRRLLAINRALVESGEAWAVCHLGYELLQAEGTARDDLEAVACFEKAMQWHDPRAMRLLAAMNYEGRGVGKNLRRAAELFHEAAELGDSESDLSLAQMYLAGEGVATDPSTALRHVRAALDRGNPAAIYRLGRLYEYGLGVTKDLDQAIACYREGAEAGDSNSQVALGGHYGYGIGVSQNSAECLKWYHRAALQGDPTAQYGIGTMARNGDGVRRDYQTALDWLRLAAKQGHLDALNTLGVMYERGEGVQADAAQSARYYQEAAEKGCVIANDNLGCLYARGGPGLARDYATALQWLRRGTELHDAGAQYDLGVMYQNGWGVEADREQAVAWFLRAAEQGHAEAGQSLAAYGISH